MEVAEVLTIEKQCINQQQVSVLNAAPTPDALIADCFANEKATRHKGNKATRRMPARLSHKEGGSMVNNEW